MAWMSWFFFSHSLCWAPRCLCAVAAPWPATVSPTAISVLLSFQVIAQAIAIDSLVFAVARLLCANSYLFCWALVQFHPSYRVYIVVVAAFCTMIYNDFTMGSHRLWRDKTRAQRATTRQMINHIAKLCAHNWNVARRANNPLNAVASLIPPSLVC